MDFLNKKNFTTIIIFIFILLSLVHLFNMKSVNSSGTESFVTLTEDQIFSPNIKITIPSTDLVQFGALGTSTTTNNLTTLLNSKIGLNSNNILQVQNILAGKINMGVGGTPVRNTINCPEPMFISSTGDLTLESTSNTNVVGNLKIGTGLVINSVATSTTPFSTINSGTGYLGMQGNMAVMIYNKEGLYISKDAGGNGNLSVSGNLYGNGSISATSALVMTGSGSSGIGGALSIINTDKIGPTEAQTWNIYNMKNYNGSLNGLSFWKYGKTGCTANSLCAHHMTLQDDGTTLFGGAISIGQQADRLSIYAPGCMSIGHNAGGLGIVTSGYISALYFYTSSDKRLKENIKNITQNDKDKLLQLVPKKYNMIADNTKQNKYGLIAQEVEKLFPEFIIEDPKGMKSLNYESLIPLLLDQIKDLTNIINNTLPNPNVINIGGVTLTSNELLKLKQLINN